MLLVLLVLWPVTGLEIESDYEQARPIAERIMQRVGCEEQSERSKQVEFLV